MAGTSGQSARAALCPDPSTKWSTAHTAHSNSDVISVEWFKSHGGLTRANGDHFRTTLLSRGHSQDAMDLFRNFTGHEPDIKPLLARRGLDQPAPKP